MQHCSAVAPPMCKELHCSSSVQPSASFMALSKQYICINNTSICTAMFVVCICLDSLMFGACIHIIMYIRTHTCMYNVNRTFHTAATAGLQKTIQTHIRTDSTNTAWSLATLTWSVPLLQVQKRPLKVAVEHLKDLPYNTNDDIVKATNMELVATLKDLLAQHPIYREQLQSSFQFGSDFQDLSRLSDMAAALTSAQEADLQNVLAELSIPDR